MGVKDGWFPALKFKDRTGDGPFLAHKNNREKRFG